MKSGILQPGRTVWRVEPACRAAVLVDAAAYYAAVRAACLKARRRIIVLGWDIDSRTALVGERPPTDGLPTDFRTFLTELVATRPALRVDLLLWDYSLLYAHEREMMPRLSLDWQTPPQVSLCLDSTVPFGSSQHQKIVIVDDALAFSGGLDLTIRRWDTARHEIDDARRVDPAGEPYRPFHDVQMMVDGAAARALAELARQRWCHARSIDDDGAPPLEPGPQDVWPDHVPPDFTDVAVGIARTQPRYHREQEVREVEMLFLDSIARAERTIYIENQFATATPIAVALSRQLRRRPELEVVIVAPRSHDSFVERRTMRNGRIRFWKLLRAAGGARVRLVYPHVEKGGKVTDTMIHSKIMVIDDRVLRVGSANLNNRSMGADTECDLAIEARDGAAGAAERAAIVRLRNRLLGEHCGVSAERVAASLAEHGSLVRVADTLSARGHALRPIDDGTPDRSLPARLVERIADPARPLRWGRLAGRQLPRLLFHGWRGLLQGPGLVLGAAALVVLALTLAWHFTGLSDWAGPDRVRALLAPGGETPWTFVAVLALFVMAGVLAFPVVMLILATAAVYGPWFGLLYSALGVTVSAALGFWLGRRFGRDGLDRLLGPRWSKARDRLRSRGLLAVVAVRVVPVAPFTLVNLAAGASGIRPLDFALGSLIGMGPGMVVMSLMGDRLAQVISDPDAVEIGLLALCVVAWLGVSVGAQALVAHLGNRST